MTNFMPINLQLKKEEKKTRANSNHLVHWEGNEQKAQERTWGLDHSEQVTVGSCLTRSSCCNVLF